MVEHGTVKFFDQKRLFGFIADKTGDVFFHYYNGSFISCDGESVRFDSTRLVNGKIARLRYPNKGDRVTFVRTNGLPNDQAQQWCYSADWNLHVGLLNAHVQQRKNRPMVRVVRDTENGTTVVWEGKDTSELSALHPKRELNGRPYDELNHEFIDTTADTNVRFENRASNDGMWTECDDPRVWICCVRRDIFLRFARKDLLSQGNCRHR